MSWLFGNKEKKRERLPELPELPPLPRLESSSLPVFKENPEIKNELPALPSFPSSSIGERISREAVKHAVKEPEFMPEEIYGEEQEKLIPRTIEIETEETRKKTPRQIIREISPSIKAEPVFVRIDKYQAALTEFQEIKKKLLEIESFLKDIKDIKAKEESELEEWENETRNAKEKLDSIDRILFQKLEE